MRGRWLVVAIVAVGVSLAVVGGWMRARRGPTLPLQPGTILLVVAEHGAVDLGPFAAESVEFGNAHGVSNDAAATRRSIASGRPPRESARAATIAERLVEQGFESSAFTSAREVDVWLHARGAAPSFAELDLADAAQIEDPAFLARLASTPLGERLVLVVVELDGPGGPKQPRLRLRTPGGLLRAGRDERDVSLLDVAPTLLELYGVAVPPELMEPFLLAPRTRGPRFFLFTRPLAPPRSKEDGSDAIELLAAGHRYVVDPAASPPEQIDGAAPADLALRAELRRILESAFHYQVDDGGKSPIARFVGRSPPR